MLIIDYNNCTEIIAGDKTILRELLHPNKQNIDLRYSLAVAIVKPGEKSTIHSLKTSEVYYIIKGHGIMHIEDESKAVSPKQAIYIPPYKKQWIENTSKENLEFICIVDPAWQIEDEIIN